MSALLPKYSDISCKVCKSPTSVIGVKDFNRTCEEEKGRVVFAPMGFAIYYHQCSECGFIFTVDLDDWSKQDFLDNIYNDDYIKVDPDYQNKRAMDCIQWFEPLLGGDKSISILDYGAGTDSLSQKLKSQGYDASGWDPMWMTTPDFDQNKKFDVITAFEVLEHTPTPWETTEEIISFLNPESGQIIISTLISDIIRDDIIDYWYLAPRNGHVCMHSAKSLAYMFDKLGMEIQHFSPSQHVVSWK